MILTEVIPQYYKKYIQSLSYIYIYIIYTLYVIYTILYILYTINIICIIYILYTLYILYIYIYSGQQPFAHVLRNCSTETSPPRRSGVEGLGALRISSGVSSGQGSTLPLKALHKGALELLLLQPSADALTSLEVPKGLND